MLTRDERTLVIEALSEHVGLDGSIGLLITLVFQGLDRTELGSLPVDLRSVRDQSIWVVDSCLSSRWRRVPSLMELLLTRLVSQAGQGALEPALERVQRKEDPNPDPFDTFWVLADQPFLDREPLRPAARRLVEESERPILRVNGPSYTGKSYTVELLNFVMQHARPDLHVVPVKLGPEMGRSYEVAELAESLTLSMVTDSAPSPGSGSSYAGALCRWVVRNANRNPGIWVFVLDGFGQPLQDDVASFIDQLVDRVNTPEYARKMRLVFLGFDRELKDHWKARTVDDGPLPLDGVTVDDLVNCLRAFNAKVQALGQPGRMIREDHLSVVAEGMLARSAAAVADGKARSKLHDLHDQLFKLSRGVPA